MANYNPMDMAYVLKMQKKGQMTPEELQLMQNINQAMLPEVAAGNVGILPPSGGISGPAFSQIGGNLMGQAPTNGMGGSALSQIGNMTPAQIQQMELMKMRGR
jgi:hypothetical protein